MKCIFCGHNVVHKSPKSLTDCVLIMDITNQIYFTYVFICYNRRIQLYKNGHSIGNSHFYIKGAGPLSDYNKRFDYPGPLDLKDLKIFIDHGIKI